MDDFTGADIAAGMSGGGDPSPVAADSAVAPTPETTTAATGTGTTPPAAVSPTPAPARPAGPIPFEVHQKALDNARVKAVEELRAKVGWAETISQAEYQQVQGLARRLSADPVNALQELIAEVNANPKHAEQVRSLVAKSLAASRGSQTMPSPDVEITDANGNVVGGAYSDKAMVQFAQALTHQVLSKVDEKYAPVVKTHQTLEAQRQHDHDVAEGQKFATGLLGELKDYPHFETNKAAIGADVLRQIQQVGDDARTNDPAWLEAATLRAYHRVVTTRQDALSRQAAVHDLTTKGSGTGVTPGRAPVGAPKRGDDGRFTGADIAAEFSRRKIG